MKQDINPRIAVVGLGYVGLPLALALGEQFDTTGIDVNSKKVAAYRAGQDPAGEMNAERFAAARRLTFADDVSAVAGCDVVIVAVPTPIDDARQPDLTPLRSATQAVAPHISRGCVVVFESTVYPGVTDDVCGPLLEAGSGLKRGVDFKLGYSPERMNPGDQEHTLQKIVKVVSAEDEESLALVSHVYGAVVDAGIHQAESIKVAEAAKVIENIQRDLNIALMNELAIIFDRLDLDTAQVLRAAETKWNFLPFKPGLVGGHCIGVDPYYLTYRAQMAGLHPEVILAGRKTNDGMGRWIAEQTVKKMIQLDQPIRGARVLVLGITFKENCGDVRNTRVVDIVHALEEYGVECVIADPRADAEEVHEEYGLTLTPLAQAGRVSAIVAAVAHREFKALGLDDLAGLKNADTVPFMDVKASFDRAALEQAGYRVWRL